MPNANEININLLPRENLEETSLGKSISWMLTIGKSIVFMTFSIIVFSFLYRFNLDKKVEILQEEVQNNINEINSLKDEEQEIRNIQAKLDFSDELLGERPNIAEVLRRIENSLPIQSSLSELTLNNNKLTFEGVTDNEVTFSNFLTALKKQEPFREIVIDNLKSGGVKDPTINFKITLVIK